MTHRKTNWIGNEIQRIRNEKGLTRKELVAITGVALPTLVNIENCQAGTSAEKLEILLNALGYELEVMAQ